MLEWCVFINTGIETWIVISIWYGYSLLRWKRSFIATVKWRLTTTRKLTSPVAATWPVMPIFMGKRDSKGLVRGASSSSLRSSLASKSNTREKLPLDASCTSSICGENRAHHQHKIVIRVISRRCKCHCQSLTCTLWHWIKLCIWVNILNTMCSIVLCSSNIIRAKSNSTWFRLTSSWDFS